MQTELISKITNEKKDDVKSIMILYDDTEVFERHHVALKINNRLHWPGASYLVSYHEFNNLVGIL